MIQRSPGDGEILLAALEDELLAGADDDILAGSDAGEIVARVQAIIATQVRPRIQLQERPGRAAPRRDRRGRAPGPRRDKRQMVDSVLVASPIARSLASPESVAIMDEDELDQLLARLRMLGVPVDAEDEPGASQGD